MLVPCSSRARRALALAGGVLVILLETALPAAADEVASGQQVVGTVVRAYVEHKGEQDAGARTDYGAPLTWIDRGDGSSVRLPTGSLADVPVGATVAVKVGAQVTDSATTTDHLQPAQQVIAASVVAPATTTTAPSTAGTTPAVTDSVSIAMVTPAGSTPDGTSLSTIVSQVSGPVAQFWATQSQGAIQVGVADTHDWGTVPVTVDCSDPYALWNQAAQDIGFVPGAGKHLLLYVPSSDTQCAYGLAEIGSSLHAGGYLYVRDTLTSVIAHELGHNFGLLHSGSEECQGSVETGTCDVQEYGDIYDVMGASWQQVGSLNAAQADRLGLLPSTQVQSLTAPSAGGTYTLAPLSAASGVRAIRLTASSGRVYYLEYRAASGQDAYLGDAAADIYGLPQGVLLHRAQQNDTADSAMLLDATPTSGSDYAADGDDVFPVGSAVTVADGSFTVTVVGVGTNATVRVGPVPHAPIGSLDVASVTGQQLTVAGWALDPDAPATSIPVHVYVDGVGTPVTANGTREDVAGVVAGAGPAHGYSWTATVSEGPHTVCTYGIDVAEGPGNSTLGCRMVLVVPHAPIGSLDVVSVSGQNLSVAGWALDPDAPTTSIPVHVYVDGVGTPVTADGSRQDVAGVVAGAGPAHGYSFTRTVSPGFHAVCAYGIDVAEGPGNSTLGCQVVLMVPHAPIGSLDVASVSGGQLTVAGWALDPDAPAVSIPVNVYVDGVGTPLTANGARQDVAGVLAGAGPIHGYSFTTPVSPGFHAVCAYGIDVAAGPGNSTLGCRIVGG